MISYYTIHLLYHINYDISHNTYHFSSVSYHRIYTVYHMILTTMSGALKLSCYLPTKKNLNKKMILIIIYAAGPKVLFP